MGAQISAALVALSAIFFVVDPVGLLPIFLAVTAGDTPEKKRRMAARASLIAAAILTFFAVAGGILFRALNVTLAAFQIAGGILLLVTALDMLRTRPQGLRTSGEELAEAAAKDDIAVVPLAMPLLAGPGAIATVVVLTARARSMLELVPILLSIWITCLSAFALLGAAGMVDRFLGKGGRSILERVMGMLLAAIAVQFMIGGLREALPEVFAAVHA